MPRAPTQAEGQALRRLIGFVAPLVFVGALAGLSYVVRAEPRRPVPEVAAEPPPELWVEPASGRAARVPAWADPRWADRLAATLAAARPFPVGDPGGPDEVASALRRLSFVREVERCEADPVRGLISVVALRRPVACVRAGDGFLLVDEEGVVLEGDWPSPPRLGALTLPVLGPLEDPLLREARPGDWLVEPEHLAALEVVRSLRANVPAAERARLGRLVVDARDARRASVDCPGIRLELEGGRVALFGRTPGAPEPGELAAATKWRSLVRALELFEADPAANDWRLVDLRWDRPELALRDAPVASRPSERVTNVASSGGPAARPRRDGSRDGPPGGPRVR